jgi:hypothetical protein
MALTNAEKQASWRERNRKSENGAKLRAQFISTSALWRSSDRLSQGLLGNVSHQGSGWRALSAGSLISSRARRTVHPDHDGS